ncbi:MAG: hypothetical protein COA83_11380, partial [Methylophaga sp.]
MATDIGIVKTLIGTAVAIDSNGSERNLLAGDKVYADEVIATGSASAIEIEFSDGSLMDMGRNSQALLDAEIFDPQQTADVETETDIAALQQAILDGDDPLNTGEATAAGSQTEGGNEGVTAVVIDHLAPIVEVTSGFETTGPTVAFPELTVEEQGVVNGVSGPPTVTIDDEDLAVTTADHSVVEATGSTIVGDITVTASAGNTITAVTVGGLDITNATAVNVVLPATAEGQLTITGYDAGTGAITYSYVEDSATEDHTAGDDSIRDSFIVSVTDTGGATATNSLDIQIIDTAPTANVDVNAIDEGSATVVGNVVTTGAGADTLGADATSVTGAAAGTSVVDVVGGVALSIAGTYGSVVINANGSYTYTLDNSNTTVQGLDDLEAVTDTFSYTITDQDGDSSTTTLVITVNGQTDGPPTVTIENTDL